MDATRDLRSGEVILEELSREECLSLLSRAKVGRIGGVVRGRPFIFPVNFVLDGETVVFRTDPGTKLDGTGFGRVAFEIDGIDEDAKTGWSVLVQGVGTEITDMVDHLSQRLREVHVLPWVSGDKAHWVAVQAESITGRRLVRA